MKRIFLIIAAVATIALSGVITLSMLPVAQADNSAKTQALSSEQTVAFSIEKMTCAMCPITVRKAMEKIEGVKSVVVDYDTKTATVIFDPAVATPAQIGAASTSVGYPASPIS